MRTRTRVSSRGSERSEAATRVRVAALLAAVAVCALGAPAGAEQVIPVGGSLLRLELLPTDGGPEPYLDFRSNDPAVAAPFANPRLGASLHLGISSASGQCRVELGLDPSRWRPVSGNGAQNGYFYWASANGNLVFAVLQPGRLQVIARGAPAACDLSGAQNVPVSAELRVAGDRYCATFGGDVESNQAERFLARDSAAPTGCPDADVTVANLNILHGHDCDPLFPDDGDQCRVADRTDLLVEHIIGVGCPDIVTTQENIVNGFIVVGAGETKGPLENTVTLLEQRLPLLSAACGFDYEIIFDPENAIVQGGTQTARGNDEELILTRYPALPGTAAVTLLYSATDPFFSRHVLQARIDHPVGPLDVYTTHLASGADNATAECGAQIMLLPGVPSPPCPPECDTSMTVRECQARQMALLVEATHDVDTPAVLTGDFNTRPDTDAYLEFTSRGWIDTYQAAGNPECDPDPPGTGVGCTSGKSSSSLIHMESTGANVRSRIDFTFLVPPGPGSQCAAILDPASDPDGDGGGTRHFADEPNPFAPACGPAPLPMCWPSDHEGTELDLNCAP